MFAAYLIGLVIVLSGWPEGVSADFRKLLRGLGERTNQSSIENRGDHFQCDVLLRGQCKGRRLR